MTASGMIPHKPATLYQRVQLWRLASGNIIVTLYNRDGTWRDGFLMANLDSATTHATPDLTQPTRGTK